MAVLMSYHKLVERDSKHVDFCWKYITICVLVLAIVCCFTGAWSLHKLIETYDDQCILGADLKFSLKPQPSNLVTNSSSFASSEAKSFTSEFTPQFVSRLGPIDGEQPYSEDLNFLDEYKIDEGETLWGSHSTCDFAIYIPIFQLCFGCIIIVMFIICGKGGKAEENSFLPKPWRIVTPSIIFFLTMTCTSIAYLTSIYKGMDKFCSGFADHIPNIGCLVPMDNFILKDGASVYPSSILYIMVLTFNWISLACWIVLLSIMIARVMFVIDFQLVRVTIKTCEQHGSDKTNYQVIEPHEQDKDGNAISSEEC